MPNRKLESGHQEELRKFLNSTSEISNNIMLGKKVWHGLRRQYILADCLG